MNFIMQYSYPEKIVLLHDCWASIQNLSELCGPSCCSYLPLWKQETTDIFCKTMVALPLLALVILVSVPYCFLHRRQSVLNKLISCRHSSLYPKGSTNIWITKLFGFGCCRCIQQRIWSKRVASWYIGRLNNDCCFQRCWGGTCGSQSSTGVLLLEIICCKAWNCIIIPVCIGRKGSICVGMVMSHHKLHHLFAVGNHFFCRTKQGPPTGHTCGINQILPEENEPLSA